MDLKPSVIAPTALPDDVLDAIDELVKVLEENSRRSRKMLERARQIRVLRQAGKTYSEIALAEERPLMVEMATADLEALVRAGSRLRRSHAKALHTEGLTMDRIAELFGVTRQRISALLRASSRAA